MLQVVFEHDIPSFRHSKTMYGHCDQQIPVL